MKPKYEFVLIGWLSGGHPTTVGQTVNRTVYYHWTNNPKSHWNDIRITNPSLTVDPNISDEEGYTIDFGARGRLGKYINYDANKTTVMFENDYHGET